MTRKVIILLLFALTSSCWNFSYSQDAPAKDWDAGKIKGARQYIYTGYKGFPYLTEDWCPGKIELASGEIIDSLFMRYSSFKDEIIYYNKVTSAQIIIDKASLNGFEFFDAREGHIRKFRKQYFDNYLKNYRFFEILYDGPVNILAYRKVNLNTVSPYHDKNDVLKNMEYIPEYQFYFYSPEQKAYSNVRPGQASFLSKFDKASQKPVKKLLRKKRIRVEDENSLVQAWKTVEEQGFKIVF